MKNQPMTVGFRYLVFALSIGVLCCINTSFAQRIKWLRVTPLQAPINEIGAIYESEVGDGKDFQSWPAQYSIEQTTYRAKGFWIGCKHFDDPLEGKVKSIKIVGAGPRDGSSWSNMVFPTEFKLLGKEYHPVVTVDDQLASALYTYDILDSRDPNLEADRVMLVKFNTSIGVSVTQKTLAFDNSNHDNYFIKDWVFKNTGIYDAAGNVKQQTLDSVWFYFVDRTAFSGVSVPGYGQGWGAWSSDWGNSDIIHSFGADPNAPDFEMRGLYQWYGPNKDRPVTYAEDWGCPNQMEDGTMSNAKYVGVVIIHADKSASDKSDDLWQPRTNHFIGSDLTMFNATASQYDEIFMADRWTAITDGHPAPGQQLSDLVGDDYPINYQDTRRNTFGGPHSHYACGPYKLAPGDSIHIVTGEGVAGISWEKSREVGGNWFQWYKKTGTPTLIMPDGSSTTDCNLYKRRWCETGKDSIMQTLRNAAHNYAAGYNLPKPPPPPDGFKVTSGGDRIMLEWSDNADAAPHSDGYVVYRSQGNVLDRRTVYNKIFECGKGNVVHRFDDITASRGFDYYYYIQSKDDGTQNDVHPGQPLYSSMFWTVTSLAANLQRPAVSKADPDKDKVHWDLMTSRGTWTSGSDYAGYVKDTGYTSVTFNDSTYVCFTAISNSTTNPNLDGANWKLVAPRGGWGGDVIYTGNNSVTNNGSVYVCLLANLGGKTTPDAETSIWKPNVADKFWIADSTYALSDIVPYNGSTYISRARVLVDSTHRIINPPPDADARHWKKIVPKGDWDPGTTYFGGDAVNFNNTSYAAKFAISGKIWLDQVRVVPNPYDIRNRMFQFGDQSQYDQIAFYGLPPVCKMKIFTERGDLIWEKDHTRGTGDEIWDSLTSSGQIITSGIYILYVETPEGQSVYRKFVVIR